MNTHQQPHAPLSSADQGRSQGQPYISLSSTGQKWHGSEEAMRNWLRTRVEEEKAKQEAEKSRQESLRLEQRRVELDMLRETLRNGIAPPMLPWVLAALVANRPSTQTASELSKQFPVLSQSQHFQHLPMQRQPFQERYVSESASRIEDFGMNANLPHPQNTRGYGRYPWSPKNPSEQRLGAIGRSSTFSDRQTPSWSGQRSGLGHLQYLPQADRYTQPAPRPSNSVRAFHQWRPPGTETRNSGPIQHKNTPTRCESEESETRYKLPFSSAIIGGSRKGCTGTKLQLPGTHSLQRFQTIPPFKLGSFSDPPSDRKRGHKRRRTDVSLCPATSHDPQHHVHHHHHIGTPKCLGGNADAFSGYVNTRSDPIDKQLDRHICISRSIEEDRVFKTTEAGTDTCVMARRWSH